MWYFYSADKIDEYLIGIDSAQLSFYLPRHRYNVSNYGAKVEKRQL